MTAKKLFALILSVAVLIGPAGIVVAQEKKADDAKAAETTPGKAVSKAKTANGTVKAATPDSVTVVGKGDREWTFSVDPKTSIKKAGKAVVPADLKAGDAVHVQFHEVEGKLIAKSITVRAGGTAKKEQK